jgi:hypothetical protein
VSLAVAIAKYSGHGLRGRVHFEGQFQ